MTKLEQGGEVRKRKQLKKRPDLLQGRERQEIRLPMMCPVFIPEPYI
jgi:hypothetical protein